MHTPFIYLLIYIFSHILTQLLIYLFTNPFTYFPISSFFTCPTIYLFTDIFINLTIYQLSITIIVWNVMYNTEHCSIASLSLSHTKEWHLPRYVRAQVHTYLRTWVTYYYQKFEVFFVSWKFKNNMWWLN